MNYNHSEHTHHKNCGHIAVKHEGHVDYIHDGHLHTPTGEEHKLEVSEYTCACNDHVCEVHHTNQPGKNNIEIPHGDHTDSLIGNHLHHRHENHCDYHGKIIFA